MASTASVGGVALVGRETELARLSELLGLDPGSTPGAAPGAEPVGVLLSGDAGVGKTRLLSELAGRAEAVGWRVVVGHCLDFGDSALSYLPFSEVVGRLTTELPEVVAEVATSHPALARLQPGRRVLGEGDLPRDAESLARTDLVEAVHALLDVAAARQPLLLVVEDAHWADRSTRELLGFLFRRPFAHRVAIVVSYRSDDLHRRHPLRPQVAEWTRIRGVERLHLEPLDDADVRTLVRRLHPAPLPEARVRGIVDRADGNAFFVEELVGAPDDGRPSADLADVLLVRLDRLDDDARAVVRAASVAGRRVGHDQLVAASGLVPGLFEAGLRAAVEGNVLVADQAAYSFRHALLAEATYDDLLPGERVRLHARYAEALRDGLARGTAAELARHARLAGDLDTALRASIRAGDEARSIGGPDEAASHYQQALELVSAHPTAEVDLTDLAVVTAEALVDSGQPERAAALLADQLRRTEETRPLDRARLLAARALALIVYEPDEDPVAVSAEAVTLVPDEPTALRARVLAAHARVASAFEREGGESAGVEALAIAERLDLTGVASDVRMTLIGLRRAGPRDALRSSLVDAVGRASASGALWAEVRGRFLLARSYQDWAEFEPARTWFESVLQLGLAAGAPWAPYVLDSRWHLAQLAWVQGDWDGALAHLDVTGQDPPALAAALMSSLRLTIQDARGADVGDQALALRPAWSLDGAIVIYASPLVMDRAARAGDAPGVIASYDDAVGVLGQIWDPWFGARLRLACTALGLLADLLPRLPSAQHAWVREQADRLVRDGRAVRVRHNEPSGGWGPEGQAWLLLLEAEERRLRWVSGHDVPVADELVLAWREAVAGFERLGQLGETARVRALLAGVLKATGDPAGARVEGDRARESAHRLGATSILGRLQSIGLTPVRSVGPEQLTPRETEILALVALGRTNGEIGRQLFISTKTVSVHVSNILGKLGASGRTEAAAVARRRGLLT